MTAHKPATPLPWTYNWSAVNKEFRVIPNASGYGTVAMATNETNAVFIAHAANNYPRLIEVLRVLADGYEPDLDTFDQRKRRATLDAMKAASALLRELGEAE